MELALRVDKMDTAVPKLYPDTPQAQRLSAPTGPCPTCSQDPRLGMGAPSPPSGPLTHERCSRERTPRRGRCLARGPRVKPRDASTLLTRTGYLLIYLAPSLMPKLHDTWEQEAGGENVKSALATLGIAPTWTPGAETTTPCTTQHDFDSTPKAYRLGVETTTHQSTASGQFLPARPNAWNIDSEGAELRRRVLFPTAAAPRGRPGAGSTTPGFDTDPTINAQWVSLRWPTQTSKTAPTDRAPGPNASGGP